MSVTVPPNLTYRFNEISHKSPSKLFYSYGQSDSKGSMEKPKARSTPLKKRKAGELMP